MNKIVSRLAFALALLFLGRETAHAQYYPKPGSASAPPVLCTGCGGTNWLFQPNDGLKTWPYSEPLLDHVGRYVDSVYFEDVQDRGGGTGYRTARARKIRISREPNGSAPPRAYIQIGSGIGVYSLNTFFNNRVKDAVSIGALVPWGTNDRKPAELVARWDAYFYAESAKSGWETVVQDGQDRLFDFDVDDRGYLYPATGPFGWGIVKDNGETNGAHLTKVVQKFSDDTAGISASTIVALRSGSRYYALISSRSNPSAGIAVFDVTTPSAPVLKRSMAGNGATFKAWAKHDGSRRIGILLHTGEIQIFDYDDLITGGGPVASFTAGTGKQFKDVTVDDDGNFWSGHFNNQYNATKIVKFRKAGSSYDAEEFDNGGGNFSTETISYGDNYIVAVGHQNAERYPIGVRLFKVEGGQPVSVPLDNFFTKYYHQAPSNYAQPPSGELSSIFGAYTVKWNNKTYLIYSAGGIGDVFELQAGDSISVTKKGAPYGRTNPHARSTEPGPFYGDILKFNAKSSNPSFEYNVEWDFDNPESGSDNTGTSRTPDDVTHQFTGLNTVAKINAPKTVKATVTVDQDMTDSVSVALAVPVARIGVDALADPLGNTAIDLVAGDEFTDASDGTIDGHFSEWTIDGTMVQKTPDQTVPVGDLGEHTVALSAKYGAYDTAFDTVGSPFVATVPTLNYTVRPFVAAFKPASTAGTAVTFKAQARVTAVTGLLTATNWTVSWKLANASGTEIHSTSASAPVGTIPDFTIADKSVIVSGSVVTLTVSVTPTVPTASAIDLNTYVLTQTLVTPDPSITKSGCLNVGTPCTFTAGSLGGNSTAGWSYAWTLKRGTSTVKTFNGNPFKPTFTEEGNYSVSVVASTNLFESTKTESVAVAGAVCNDPPTINQMSIFTDCDSCNVGQSVRIEAEGFGYELQDCDQYVWTFGDGQSLTTDEDKITHTYTSARTSAKITLVVKKSGKNSPTFEKIISVGGGGPDPEPDVCTSPSNITITYSGSKGCKTGQSCKNTENITFTAKRTGGASLQTCDKAAWSWSDSSTSTADAPKKTFSTPGTYTANVKITNTKGNADAAPVTFTIVNDSTGTCTAPPTDRQFGIEFIGATSGCDPLNAKLCSANESIRFYPVGFSGYTFQSCDRYEWNFADGGTSTSSEATHAFAGTQSAYRVSLRIWNSTNTTGTTVTVDVPFSAGPILPTPTLAFASFPAAGTVDVPVNFTVNSNLSASGWNWDFGDGKKDTSQASQTGTSKSIAHTYTAPGTYTVTVKARNAQGTPTHPTGQAVGTIVVTDIPEYKYLLPVVTRGPGQNGSVWRTDVQIYNSDPNVSVTNPLLMTARLRDIEAHLEIRQSTITYEDFMKNFTTTNGSDSGSIIITTRTKFAPQIWTRTYNQTEQGTFGQFIPAIRLDSAGGGSAIGEGRYYIAGLRNNDRFRTNLGFVNPNASTVTATIRFVDDKSFPIGQPVTRELQPLTFDQFGVGGVTGDLGETPFRVEVEVPAGQWLIAYASLIDNGSNDPVYIPAVRESDLTSADLGSGVLPGVGHVGRWRSDMTLFNPDPSGVTVTLAYYDDKTGQKMAEAPVQLAGGTFRLFTDVVKDAFAGSSIPDSVGMIRYTVPAGIQTHYPLAFARTYNDEGTGKTYGQGISGVAASRANVKPNRPGLIPAIRVDASYYTNIGLTNVSDTDASVTVKMLDPNSGAESVLTGFQVKANQSLVTGLALPAGLTSGSLKIETTGGNIWAFASIVDVTTKDPEYVPATPIVP